MSLNDIVNVVLTRGTRSVPMPTFSVAAILSDDCNFVDRVRYYADADSLADDLMGGISAYTYGVASALKAPSSSPSRFAVINRLAPKMVSGNFGTYTAGAISITVNGQAISQSYSSIKATTLTALAAAIQAAHSTIMTCTYSSTLDSLTFTPISTTPVAITAIDYSAITGSLQLFKRSIRVIKDNAGTLTTGSKIIFKVNGTSYTVNWTTDKDTTLAAVATALRAITEIESNSGFTAYDSVNHNILVGIDNGVEIDLTVDYSLANGTFTCVVQNVLTDAETVTAALNAAQDFSNGWYLVLQGISTTGDPISIAKQLLISAWVESNKKFTIQRSTDIDTVDVAASSDTTSLAAQVEALSYARTAVVYGGNADTQFPDAVLAGTILPMAPGSYTAMFKTLPGVVADGLTVTQMTNAKDKKASVYTNQALDIVDNGATAAGEWIDIVIGLDWLVALIQNNVMTVFVNNNKLPFDDRGITAITGAISKAMEAGVASSLLTQLQVDSRGAVIGGYKIVAPKAVDVSAADKANRTLTNVQVTGFLAGAIHATTINVTVLY